MEVLDYCKHKNLPIVNMFIAQEISDEQKLYQVINEAMEFATQDGIQNGKTKIFMMKKRIIKNG